MRDLAGPTMIGYLAVLLTLTFYPFGGSADVPGIEVRLTPFETIRGALRLGPGSREFGVLIGNLLAFVPVGVLVPLLVGHRRALTAIGAGFVLSALIELLQLVVSLTVGFTYRIADIDDVIVNTLGTALGLVIFVLVDGLRSRLAAAG